ncbi:MAG: hypothetical protein WDM91_17725 [Rhizomicrobium sp.]
MAYPATDETPPKIVVPTEEARQGETSGHVRKVLMFSLGLAVLAGIVLYVIHIM